MKPLSCFLLSAALLSSLACERTLPQARRTVYVPWETGLTLAYEDPTLPPAERAQARLQVRVAASREIPGGRRVTLAYTTLKGQHAFDFQSKDGGWALMEGDNLIFRMLPEGFPGQADHWEDRARGMTFQVVGRARLPESELELPSDYDRVGIWVELVPRSGPRRRIFLLPGIGEAKSQVRLEDGRWRTNNQLVSRGFTDLPAAKANP